MRMAGLVLGLIGGILGLIIGFFIYGFSVLGDLFSDYTGLVEPFTTYRIVGVIAPIACLVGGAVSLSRPIFAAILMGFSAVAMWYAFGIGAFTIFPIALAGVGAVLVLFEASPRADKQ